MTDYFKFPRYLFLLVPFQIVFGSRIALGNAVPDLIWIGLLWGALTSSPYRAIIAAFIISPIADSLAGLPLGITAIGWIPALWFLSRGRETTSPLTRLRWIGSIVFGGLVCEILIQFVDSRTGGNFIQQLFYVGLPSLAYTTLFAVARSALSPFGKK